MTPHHYRSQRSWAKVIFSQASVCPQGGRGVCLSACWDIPPQSRHPPLEQTPPWADTPQSRHPLEQTPPRADPPRSRHPPGSRHLPRADTSPGSRHPSRAGPPPPPRIRLQHTAQRAAGTHPTGMHSCIKWNSVWCLQFICKNKFNLNEWNKF